MVRPAIDALFRSAAVAYGPRVIGVLLSGLLNDGAAGLEAIKRCGGFAVVQDPADAIADEMPRSAMMSAPVDLAIPSARIGDVLSDLVREPAGPARPVPPDIRLEVDIAAGERIDAPTLGQIADTSSLTCPHCGGVLSTIRKSRPLRFRCQVGHALTGEALAKEQEGSADEAMRVALRIIEERADLVQRLAREGREAGRLGVAELYEGRASEYRGYADTIRRAVMHSLENSDPPLANDGQEE
jgi:two-component system, chemotaxis family, protein-glutamate methylesterase/glutaminase